MSYKIFVNGLATSKKLDEIQEELPDENISLKELINVMSGEGLQFMIIILIAPFLIPASIPGSSTPFGILIILLEIAYLNNKSLYIPDFIGKYEISKENVLKINAVVNIILAFLLFLPLPIPFTDFVPATSMLLLAVSTLEHDSYLMILGYVAAILTVIYFSSVGYVGIEIIRLTLNYIGIPI